MPRERSTFWLALGFAWQLGYTIAIPLVLLTLAGRFLDRHFSTHPWFLIVGVVLSIVTSTIALVIRASRLMADATKPPQSPHGNIPGR